MLGSAVVQNKGVFLGTKRAIPAMRQIGGNWITSSSFIALRAVGLLQPSFNMKSLVLQTPPFARMSSKSVVRSLLALDRVTAMTVARSS